MILDDRATAEVRLRFRAAEAIRRGHQLVSASRALMQHAALEHAATKTLPASLCELRGSIRENRRDLDRRMKQAGQRARTRRWFDLISPLPKGDLLHR